MALSDTCADFLAFLDGEPAPDLMEHRLGTMTAEIEAYSDRGYGPELEALRRLVRIARASLDRPVGVRPCSARWSRGSMTPGRMTSRPRANAAP